MLTRVALIAALAVLTIVVVAAVRWWINRRDRQLKAAPPAEIWESLATQPDGRPTIVVFSSPGCVACKTTQAPAIDGLTANLGDSAPRLIKVDISEQPEVAHAFRVMTVPSTVVLDVQGHVSAINHGFATGDQLGNQLDATKRLDLALTAN